MVLEEVANADGFGSEPLPQSDTTDPFANQAPSDVQITLDLSTLPKPVPIIGALVGYGAQARANRLHQSLAQAQSVLHRPLRQEEAQAIAQTYSQIMATSSWGDALGGAFGGWQCYRTAHYFRFPFWSPNLEKMNPDVLGPLRGGQARMAWHAMRAVPYLAMGAFVGDLFFRNYATVNAAMGMRKDERLADFNKALETVMQKQMQEAGDRRMRNRPLPETQQREREGLSRPSPSRRSSDDEDDVSPTGGAFNDSYGDQTGSGLLSDTQMRTNEAQRGSQADYDSRYQNQMQKETQPQASPQRRNDRSDSFDLNSSPDENQRQGNLPPWAQNRNSGQQSGSGSAWDRLRQQTSSGQAQQQSSPYTRTQGEQRQRSTVGDSFSFSSSDEERQLAKSEAQKEFDRRIERERHGKDFDEGRRW